MFVERYGPWAVIAGGSEGIGAAFAQALAARGLNIFLIARRQGPLDRLADELAAKYGVEVRTLAYDLGSADVADVVGRATRELCVGLVVCNAAVSRVAPFFDIDLHDQLRMLDVNCRAPLLLAHVLGKRMAERRRGGIVFMSSLAGVLGGPYVATYAGTKAFVCLLAESLAGELGPEGVDVIACVAGPTQTPTFMPEAAGGLRQTKPEFVVARALAALGAGPRVVPGKLLKLTTWLLGHLPRGWVVKLVAARTRKLLPQARRLDN
jgi:short-subunit dehydrogenase